jgi:hypothetical protein
VKEISSELDQSLTTELEELVVDKDKSAHSVICNLAVLTAVAETELPLESVPAALTE